jgi:RNA-binding protein
VPAKEEAPAEDRKPGSRTVKLVSFSKNGSGRPTVKKVTVHGNQRVTAGGTIKRKEQRATSVKKKAQSQ